MLKKYFKKYFFSYLLGLSAVIIVDLLQLRIPELTGQVTDGLDQQTMGRSELMSMMLLLVVIGLGVVVFRFIWRMNVFGTARKIEYNLRNDFFGHLETLSPSFYNKQKTGDLMAYATNDLNAIRMLVGPGILMLLDTIVLTTIVITKMVQSTNIELTVLAVLPMPIIAIGSLLLGNLMRKRFKAKQEAFAYMSDIVQENISGIRVVKAFVQESLEILRFKKVNQDNYDKNMKVVRIQALVFPLAMMISGVSITITLFVGGQMAMLGEITLGEFVAFIQYIMMLIWPMIALGWFINIFSQGMASVNRFNEILSVKPDIYDQEKLHDGELKGKIVMENLDFYYPETETPALKDISITIKEGQHIGIVGRTGSGKTTLVNLMMRLFDVPEGSLMVDDVMIKEWPLKTLRGDIGYVPQDSFLFSDTIENNIRFGLDEASMELVTEAAINVDVHDNIIEFEDQYDTVVGERGVTLSGGQKQRISIARALIKNPKVLILDDAVSAVDTKTEERILSHLKDVRKGKTTITIAHRISTVQESDWIYVLDEGQLAEQGTHDQLVEIGGIYEAMVRKQQLEKSISETE